MQSMKQIVKNIETAAAKKGMTMAEACTKSKVRYSTYWRWKNGSGGRLKTIERLIKVVK